MSLYHTSGCKVGKHTARLSSVPKMRVKKVFKLLLLLQCFFCLLLLWSALQQNSTDDEEDALVPNSLCKDRNAAGNKQANITDIREYYKQIVPSSATESKCTIQPVALLLGFGSQDSDFYNLSKRRAKLKNKLTSNLTFNFVLGGSTCKANVKTLVSVMTVASARSTRQTMRDTWLKMLPSSSRVAFFIAGKATPQLVEESRKFGDIVLIGNLVESYTNLTLKVLAVMDFACRLCPRVQFVVKVDHDTIINWPSISAMLQKCMTDFPNKHFIAGYRYPWGRVHWSGRWAVSKQQYPFYFYPSYMFGGAYVMRVDTCQIIEAASLFEIPPIEDAFITGILAKALDIGHVTDTNKFASQIHNSVGKVNAAAFSKGILYSATDISEGKMQRFWNRYTRIVGSKC